MIWLRRALTIPSGLLFFLLLLATLVLLQVNDTFLNPDYYPEELRKASIYEFVLVDLLTSALDEARALDAGKVSEELDENPLVTSGLSTEEIVSSVNRAIPPEWVQGQVEAALDEVTPYLVGEKDSFTVTVRAGAQVATMVDEVQGLLRKADAYNLLFDRVVVPEIERFVAEQDLPLGVELPADRVISAARIVAPPEWVQGQVEAALDEVTPYLIGKRDSFAINVPLSDRAEIALREVTSLLRETYDYSRLFDEVVKPAVKKAADEKLPLGVHFESGRLVEAARKIVTPAWLQSQVENALDEAGPYFVGRTDTFEINVQLADRAEIALDEIKALLRDADPTSCSTARSSSPSCAEP